MKPATKDERSLLLFLETRAVDHSGRVSTARMNDEDFEIATRWNEEEYVAFGRIAFEDIIELGTHNTSTHWCHLSPEAWSDVHELRRARAERLWESRTFRSTKEEMAGVA